MLRLSWATSNVARARMCAMLFHEALNTGRSSTSLLYSLGDLYPLQTTIIIHPLIRPPPPLQHEEDVFAAKCLSTAYPHPA